MKICLLTHQFLPDHRAGVELMVLRTARALEEQGQEVLVYTTRKDLSLEEGSLVREDYEGLPVLRLIRNLFHPGFAHTFKDEAAEEAFLRGVLEGFRPDILHLHHLMHHSMGIPARAKAEGVAVLMTLHDYWLDCPRFGTLLDHRGRICETVDPQRCSVCLQDFRWRNPPGLRGLSRLLRWVRACTGLDLSGPLQRLYRGSGRKGSPPGEAGPDPGLRDGIRARRKERAETLVPAVEAFLCPSLFLRRWMEDLGLPEDRLLHRPFGIPRPGAGFVRKREGRFRFGFLGSVLPHKGVHLLLEAFSLLRGKGLPVELSIHGGSASDPAYGKRIRRRGEGLGAVVGGAFPPERIDALLAAMDCLVVPSLWFENSPVTILDARVRGIPSLVAELGALPELAPDPRLRFPPGDPEALARAMAGLMDTDPSELILPPLPPTPGEEIRALLKLYEGIVR